MMSPTQQASGYRREHGLTVPVWERWGVVAILTIYLLVQLNNIRHGVFVGQDFGLHESFTRHLLAHPSQWFAGDFTNRPLLYWIGGACSRLGGAEFTYQRAALALVMLSALALGFLYASARRFIGSGVLRLSALAFAAFLPVTVITAVVYAGDTIALLPFAVSCWALGRALDGDGGKARLGFAAVAGLALTIGQLAKFTFLFMPAGVLLAIGLHWRLRRIATRPALAILCLAGVVPLCAGLLVHRGAQAAVANLPEHHHFEWRGTGEMTWRSLVLVKGTDVRILDAPTYWDFERSEGKFRRMLLAPNNFSYPALLHLGIFTDVSNFAAGGWNDARNPRPALQQVASIIAVRTGLLFSISVLAVVLLFAFHVAAALLGRDGLPSAGVVVWGLLAAAWFVPLAGLLPFVHHVYDWGYWLPRLILPALWGFSLLLFFNLDRIFSEKPRASRWIGWTVAVQCALQIASFWH